MPERRDAPPEKQGLRGWRAFLVVVGSGTLAALLVTGIIVGGLRLFASVVSMETSSQQTAPIEATGEPLASLEPEKLNLCSTTVDSLSTVSVDRVDSGEGYVDTVTEEGVQEGRTVSDDCRWTLVPEYNSPSPWEFSLQYEAVISVADEDKIEISIQEFDRRRGELESRFSHVYSQGEDSLTDESYSFYGEADGESGVTRYILLSRTKSAVYEIQFDAQRSGGDSSAIPETAFRHEAEKLVSGMEIDLSLWIPE
ncbi:hypothetical protein HDA32_000764 [Spinactinospora alkalitolerans]|uniref:Uncharacterized protein n=1 Tax=Spinactinospora alkalitolerans TaxID=687207 RepID=A0A852TU43_9ACTN|nr:hypothetical protein [Spinactinospora alkalitolerans]NYE45644.1 hypothetical protein [Spinactinospora alkalitolerans]